MRWSTVECAITHTMPRMGLTLDDGTWLICTPTHPWLREQNRQAVWCRTDQLRVGHRLVRYLAPYGQSADERRYDSRDAGWLAGITDGEGCLILRAGKRNPNVTSIVLAQNTGLVLAELRGALLQLGFDFSEWSRQPLQSHHGEGNTVRIKGGSGEILRFLGGVRPVRLLQKFLDSERGEQLSPLDTRRIIEIECLDDGPITSLQTSTKTYIAEGFGAHNCFILDDNARWFMSKYKHFAPKWFLEAYRRAETLPMPPPVLEAA
jgi:hypothetical protein